MANKEETFGFRINERDMRMLEAISRHFECKRSEAARRSIELMYEKITSEKDIYDHVGGK